MITLEEILVFAKSNSACEAQLKAFEAFLESGDELSAWQTVFGNKLWLRKNGLEIDQMFLEEKAQGVGKFWYSNGQLCELYTFKDGKEDGPYKRWYAHGQLSVHCIYRDGRHNGPYQKWDDNGELRYSHTYKEGICI